MEFPKRDILKSESGQALIEYVLILVATVAIILGGLYQLNTAFKGWANNYFGNYIACLLETGELPTMGGNPGDSGICNQIFKPFSLAEGRRLSSEFKPGGTEPTERGRSSTGTRDGAGGNRVGGNGGGGGGGSSFGNGRMGNFGRSSRKAPGRAKGRSGTFTGNMAASDYGAGNGRRKRLTVSKKAILDAGFALRDEREPRQRSAVKGTFSRRPADQSEKKPPITVKRDERKKDQNQMEESNMTIPNLLKWLIIAGIIIALIVFLGGQGLQINKSMK